MPGARRSRWWWLIWLGLPLLLFAVVGVLFHRPLQQWRAVKRLESKGVGIYFANELDVNANEVKTWTWLEEALLPRDAYVRVKGLDFRTAVTSPASEAQLLASFHDINRINLAGTSAGDADIAALARIPSPIAQLVLRRTHISDACVADLVRMGLYSLDIDETAITSAGENEIRKQLPECEIRDLTRQWPRH